MEPLLAIVILLETILALITIYLLNDYLKSKERKIIKKTNREMLDCKKILEDYESSN